MEKTENKLWENMFYDEGVAGIVTDWALYKKKNQLSIYGDFDDLDERLLSLNPRLSEIKDTLIKIASGILNELSNTPNLIYYNNEESYEVTACEVIRKHIKLGNIKVDTTWDNFNLNDGINDLPNLIVEDVVYEDLLRHYMKNEPNWKNNMKECYDHDVKHDQMMKDIESSQFKVMQILADAGTNVYGHDL
jgi:hypothetical protein